MSLCLNHFPQGSLFLPHFNTRAIIIAYVVDGQGGLEIASPHLASQSSEQESQQQQEEQSEGQIQRVSAKLSKGDVFIIPVAHPVALTAFKNNRLRVIGFALNPLNNQRNFLAGILIELNRNTTVKYCFCLIIKIIRLMGLFCLVN